MSRNRGDVVCGIALLMMGAFVLYGVFHTWGDPTVGRALLGVSGIAGVLALPVGIYLLRK